MFFLNDLELIPGTVRNPPDLLGVSHLLQFGTSSTRAGGQDDVSSNQLPQIKQYASCVDGERSDPQLPIGLWSWGSTAGAPEVRLHRALVQQFQLHVRCGDQAAGVLGRDPQRGQKQRLRH